MSETIPMTIEYNGDKPKFVIKLSKGDDIVLRLGGFPAKSSIDEVMIYANEVDEKGVDRPSDQPICGWRRGDASIAACTVFTIVPVSETEVTLTDNEESLATHRHWFG